MQKYFFEVSLGYAGMEAKGILEAKNDTEAEELAYQEAIYNAESFGFYQVADSGDAVYKDGEDDPEYEDYDEGCLDYVIELYDPEVHDDLI